MRIFLILFSLFIVNHAFACDHSIEFPSLTGLHSVGYKNLEFTDEGRDDPYNSGHHRKIKVTVYYPSIDAPKPEPYGDEEVDFWKTELKEPLESKKITPKEFESITQELKVLKVFKSKNGTPATGPFPVILFEHGFGVTAGSYQRMLLELVSHGYVVIAPGHPNIATTVIFDDGITAFLKAGRDALMFETAFLDTQFVLSKIETIASTTLSMDLTKIGMMGHSLGGATTIGTTRNNPHILAGISLDAPISHDTYDYDGDERSVSKLDSDIKLDYGSDFEKPFLHIFAGKPMCDPSSVHLKNNNFKAVIKGTEHNSFADHGILKGKISVLKAKGWHLGAGDTDASSYQTEMIQLIQSFFDKFLKNTPVNLMQKNSNVITVETTKD
jgi:dienelactone hydrolase